MRNAMIYVRHEPLAHLFLTYGISASDLLSDHLKVPKHLLLLPPVDEQEQIDPHTWFNIIDGADQVQDFLRSKAGQTRCWLDYSSPRFLQELTPNEIAELLYLGHAKTHLSSPFYYKLQNELVYLPLRNGMVNMYLRNESLFATFLANAINKYMRRIANEEPFWLRLRQQHFSRCHMPFIHSFYHYWKMAWYLISGTSGFLVKKSVCHFWHRKLGSFLMVS